MPAPPPAAFAADPPGAPAVRGTLHLPAGAPRDGLVLAHGAGGSAEAPLLVALAAALAGHGLAILRCQLPFRQARPAGPPRPGDAARDRAGLRAAVLALGERIGGRAALGGHSYGGRQASLLLADEPDLAPALLLLAYPLHPPGRPDEPRTAHFPRLRTPALFVHGTRDPFGGEAELRAALALLPAPAELLVVEGAGHDLGGARGRATLAERVAPRWLALLDRAVS
jgi:predicted alpha/beta-hydrolase family hydrolase